MPLPIGDDRLLSIFLVANVVLSLKALGLGVMTAATRGKLKKFINEEDAVWLGGTHADSDDMQVQRLARAHRNDIENLVPFFICGSAYCLASASPIAGLAYFGLFLIARLLHTFAYIARRPRLRRDAYSLGFLMTVVIGIHASWALVTKLV